MNVGTLLASIDPALRPWPIYGDMMEPTLPRGSLALCRPVTRYEGEGVYLMEFGAIHRVTVRRRTGVVTLTPDNKLYSPLEMTSEDFAFNVMARVEYVLKSIVEGHHVPGVLDAATYEGRVR